MEPDFDDTVRATPRPTTVPQGPDLDTTIVRGAVGRPQREEPPALVEPPEPERRAVPTAVPEVIAEPEKPRPVFRVGVVGAGEVPLDVTLYVGRKPSIPRIHVGPAPRLVTVTSPSKEVSATHLELKVVGDAVVASDMRSTNGTVVRLPGAAPRTLIRGESAVVVPGTRIDLGDGALLDILPPGGAR